MNTDKTLADVQPGGRVRLGDQAERARFEAFLSANPLKALCAGTAWEVWQAALSAQPSPGGQGDALDLDRVLSLADVHAAESREDGVRLLDRGGLLAFAQDVAAALAARQPVGQEPLWCLHVLGMDDVHPAPSKAHAEKAAAWHNEQFKDQAARLGISIEAKVVPWPHSAESHAAGVAEFIPQWLVPQWQLDALESTAARQPVGEPVAWMTHHDEPMLFPTAAEAAAYCEDDEQPVPLFRSPAQAVDLEQMPDGWSLSKKTTCYQLSHGNEIIGNLVGPDAEENAAIIARVLDSQAVGNG